MLLNARYQPCVPPVVQPMQCSSLTGSDSASGPATFPRLVMRLSGALIIIGLAAALLVPSPLLAIAGFALAGLGNSNLVPILFSAAGRDPVLGPGPGIATVTTVGFCGFLIGPAVIGLMSKFFGLSVALSLVALLGLITAVCGPAIIQSHALVPE